VTAFQPARKNPPGKGLGACRDPFLSTVGPAGYGPPAPAIVVTGGGPPRTGACGVIKLARTGEAVGRKGVFDPPTRRPIRAAACRYACSPPPRAARSAPGRRLWARGAGRVGHGRTGQTRPRDRWVRAPSGTPLRPGGAGKSSERGAGRPE